MDEVIELIYINMFKYVYSIIMLRNKLNVRDHFFTPVQRGGLRKITPEFILENIYEHKALSDEAFPQHAIIRRESIKREKKQEKKREKEDEYKRNIERYNKLMAERKQEREEKRAKKKAEKKREKDEKNSKREKKRERKQQARVDAEQLVADILEGKTEKKAEAKAGAPTGLARWQAHLKAYKRANPGVQHRQAVQDAKASYVKVVPEKKAEKKREKEKDEKDSKEDKKEAKAGAPTGLARWQAHLKAYKLANPGVPHRQAVQNAKASYRKAGEPVEKKTEKKQEKDEKDNKEYRHAKEEIDEPEEDERGTRVNERDVERLQRAKRNIEKEQKNNVSNYVLSSSEKQALQDVEDRIAKRKEKEIQKVKSYAGTYTRTNQARELAKLELDIKIAKLDQDIEVAQLEKEYMDSVEEKINIDAERNRIEQLTKATELNNRLIQMKQKELQEEEEFKQLVMRRELELAEEKFKELERMQKEEAIKKYKQQEEKRINKQMSRAYSLADTYQYNQINRELEKLDMDIKIAKLEQEIEEKQERNRVQRLTAENTKTRLNRELRENPPVVLKRSTRGKQRLQPTRDAVLSEFVKKARQKKSKALAEKYLYNNLAQFLEEDEQDEKEIETIRARSDFIKYVANYALKNNMSYSEAKNLLS